MKTNYVKCSLCLMAALFVTMTANAQTSATGKTAYDEGGYNNYDRIHSENGKQIERIQSTVGDRVYRMELVNGKMAELYVDGVKIPAADWDKYGNAIAAIREQIEKNKEQTIRNEEQARLNQIQDKKNQEQAVRNEEQARLNQARDKKNGEQAVLNKEQAQRNEMQEKKNKEQAVRNEEQARLNQLQEKKNEEQVVRNQEQARLNEIQAKKNQVQAEENGRLMKQMIADLIGDKIIPDANSLHDLTLNSDEMTVNGVKQADNVFRKYKEKYGRFSRGSFSYHN